MWRPPYPAEKSPSNRRVEGLPSHSCHDAERSSRLEHEVRELIDWRENRWLHRGFAVPDALPAPLPLASAAWALDTFLDTCLEMPCLGGRCFA